MSSNQRWLTPTAVIEPWIHRWYAWSHLVSPATAALHAAHAHLRQLRSFVEAPHLHVAALRDPAMRGGPFLEYPAERVPEVRRLLEETERAAAPQVALAEAMTALDALLQAEAKGASLEPLYPRVPEALRGYVELQYDLNHHPSFRPLEPLLYRSPAYLEGAQSFGLSRLPPSLRPFAFSTPRLPSPEILELRLPLRALAMDALYRWRREAAAPGAIAEQLGLGQAERAALEALATDQPPPPRAGHDGPGARVRYFGHACVLVESRDCSVLFDPVIGHREPGQADFFSHPDLPPRIDCVVITHNHQDHVLLEHLLELRHRVDTVVVPASGGALADPSLRLALEQLGFSRVKALEEMEELSLEGGRLLGLPFLGEHGDLNVRSKLAYHLRLAGASVLTMADSNNVEPRLYQHVRDAVGPVDLLLLGMECDGAPMSWLYGALFSKPLLRKHDQTRRLDGSNFEKARAIVDLFSPARVGVYAMGQEPWLAHVMSIQYTSLAAHRGVGSAGGALRPA